MARALLTLLCFTAVDSRVSERPDVLVAKVLAAYGGRSALERAGAVRQEGTVTSLVRGGEGRMARLFARPGSLRVEIAYPGERPEIRVVHAGRGVRDGVEVTGTPAHGAMVLQAARLALPLALGEKDARVTDRGENRRGGKRTRVLTLALADDMELTVEIDPVTHHIVRSSGSMPAPGGQIEFATEYSAFRTFDGVLFATHEENYARGVHTGATALTKIAVLAKAPEGAFGQR